MATLLERIARLDPSRSSTAAELRASVIENVRRICGSRLGSAPACPRYGLPDTIVYGPGDAEHAIPKALKDALAAAEPRLTNVSVSPLPSEGGDMFRQFEVSASLETPGAPPMKIRTKFSVGDVTVEGR